MSHGGHCCKNHGCKYGHDDCPVVLGTEPQEYRQICCDEADHQLIDSFCAVKRDMEAHQQNTLTTIDIVEKIKFLKKRSHWIGPENYC